MVHGFVVVVVGVVVVVVLCFPPRKADRWADPTRCLFAADSTHLLLPIVSIVVPFLGYLKEHENC